MNLGILNYDQKCHTFFRICRAFSCHVYSWKQHISRFSEYIAMSDSMIKTHFDTPVILLSLTKKTYQPWLVKISVARFFVIFWEDSVSSFFHFFYEIFIFRDVFNIWRSYFGKSKWNKSVHITVTLLKQSEAISAKIAEKEKATYFRCRFVIIYHNLAIDFSSHNA